MRILLIGSLVCNIALTVYIAFLLKELERKETK